MQQIVIRYGLLSGLLAAVLMTGSALYFKNSSNADAGFVVGSVGILLSMLFVFFGVRSYRETVGGGRLSFGKGLQIGILIALISCICYVIAWMVVYETLMPNFMDQYIAAALDSLQKSGASAEEIARKTAEMQEAKEMYKNPVMRFLITFTEPVPIALSVALISAAVLRKK